MSDQPSPMAAKPIGCTLAAVGMPFLAFILGMVLGAAYGGHPMSFAIFGARVYGCISAAGFALGVWALLRRERLWGLAVVAMIVNALGVLLGLWAFSEHLWNPPAWSR